MDSQRRYRGAEAKGEKPGCMKSSTPFRKRAKGSGTRQSAPVLTKRINELLK
jgi:hypothetical protein